MDPCCRLCMVVVIVCSQANSWRIYSGHTNQETRRVQKSRSPSAGHHKAGWSDFQNQRFKPDMGKMRKMRKVPLTPEKQGSGEIPQSTNAENADNVNTKCGKCRWLALLWLASGVPQEIHGSQSSMEDWDAELSPCNFCDLSFPGRKKQFSLPVTSRPLIWQLAFCIFISV